jgi:hypothetical protein
MHSRSQKGRSTQLLPQRRCKRLQAGARVGWKERGDTRAHLHACVASERDQRRGADAAGAHRLDRGRVGHVDLRAGLGHAGFQLLIQIPQRDRLVCSSFHWLGYGCQYDLFGHACPAGKQGKQKLRNSTRLALRRAHPAGLWGGLRAGG